MIPQAAAAKTSGRLSWLGGGGVGGGGGQQQQANTLLGAVPKPTRVIRDLVSRCLARIYELGDVHRMGDALYAIQTAMQAKRGSVEREARLAALVCAGVLFEALSTKAGFRLLSCFNDFVAIALKIIRTGSEPIDVRVEATRTLGKLLQGGGGKTASEQQAKDILKCVRSNLQHKSPLLVLASVNTLHALVACTPFMRPGALPPFDGESFVTTTLVPLLANPVLVVRHVMARLVAVVVANNVTLGMPAAPPSTSSMQQGSEKDQADQAADNARTARQSVAARNISNIDATTVRSSVDANGVRSSSGAQTPAMAQKPDDPGLRLSGDVAAKATPPSTLASIASTPAATAISPNSETEWNTPTLGRALAWLSASFTRASASRELRAGIIDAYAAVFDELGTTVVEAHYGTISDHVLVDLVAGTQIAESWQAQDAEILGLRNMCAWLLRVPLAQRLLTEQGKVAAAQLMWDRWLAGPLPPAMRALLEDDASLAKVSVGARAWRAASPFAQAPQARIAGSASGGEIAVLVAMHEWRQLVEGLGEAAQALDIDSSATASGVVPLERWLAHPGEAMRVAAASALGALVRHDHATRASPALAALVSRLQQLCAHCAATASSGSAALDPMRAAIGYAYGVAAVVSAGACMAATTPAPLMYVPLDLLEWIHGIAIRLLAAAYHRTDPAAVGASMRSADPSGAGAALGINGESPRSGERGRRMNDASDGGAAALANMRMNVGWILLTALASLGPDFALTRAQSQWTSMWDAALPQPDAGPAGFVTGDTPWNVRAHLLQSRTMALTHLLAYLRAGSNLPDADAQRLAVAMRFTLLFADNALDAPWSSLPNGLADPARLMRLLPCQMPILESHMMLRARIAECLCAMAVHPHVIQGVLPAASRLVESAIASSDNLHETFARRIAAAASRKLRTSVVGGPASSSAASSAAVVDGARASSSSGGSSISAMTSVASRIQADFPSCQRTFRCGPWGYEAETGTTTLLGSVYSAEGSTTLVDAGARTAPPDFATCAMGSDEFDWVAAVVPLASASGAASPESRGCQMPSSSPYVRLVDDAVRLFGTMFPELPEAAQLSQLDSLVMRLNELPFNSHRYAAVLTNILSALHAAATACLCIRVRSSSSTSGAVELSPRVARAVVEMTRAGLIMPSPAHRFVAGEIIGLLASCTRDASTSYLPYLVDHLSDQAIRSRDRFARAGTAVALGSLYSRAGSIAASRSLRQVVVLLHSLASDKDPVVHTWAIKALAEAAMSAGFMFEPYARDTFQMALKLFLTDSHTVPLHASALWLRGKEHHPPTAVAVDSAVHERVLPVRAANGPAHNNSWGARHLVRSDPHEAANAENQHQQAAAAAATATAAVTLGSIVASGADAAFTHPNSTTHHGRSADDPQWDASAADGDYRFVCARADVDAHDARAALGRLVGSLIFVFGPELQVDRATREAVLTLLRELRRALPSVIGLVHVPVAANGIDFSVVVDPDATWQTAAEFIFATQKQLLFFPPASDDHAFLPLLVRQTLRPIMQTRAVASGDAAVAGSAVFALQRVAVQAIESTLRLYGSRIVEALDGNRDKYWADWSLCDVVWEALALYNTVSDQTDASGSDSYALASDLRTLVRTAVGLVVSIGGGGGEQKQAMTLVEVLCAVFTKRSGALPAIDIHRHSSSSSGYVRGAVSAAIDSASAASSGDQFTPLDSIRQFNAATRKLTIAVLVAVLDAIGQRDTESVEERIGQDDGYCWHAHPLTPLLAELVRVGYIAATTPAAQSSTLCALGLHLVQRVVEQFSDVEDPAMRGEGIPVLAIYQAQLSSAFIPALDAQHMSAFPMLAHAAMATATAYVVSGLIADRSTMVRILRLMAPQPVFHSLEAKHSRRRRMSSASSGESSVDPLDSSTPQMHILSRIAVLHAWSVVLEHALQTRNDVLMDIVAIHVPLLSRMWLAAIRDTAVIGVVSQRDALEELAALGGSSSSVVDIGVGMSLGLESTYVPLVRGPLAAWYRYYLPQFLGTMSLLLVVEGPNPYESTMTATSRRVLKAGHDELMRQLSHTSSSSSPNTPTPPSELQEMSPSVLLLVFFVQELSRLSAVSSMPKYVAAMRNQTSNGSESQCLFFAKNRRSSSDPFVQQTLVDLVGTLDILDQDEHQQQQQSLSHAYGSTASIINVQWCADMRLTRSLLSAVHVLLNHDGVAALFRGLPALTLSWLPGELWTHAVSSYVGPLLLRSVDPAAAASQIVGQQQQHADKRNVWMDTAAMALDVAHRMLELFASIHTLQQRTLLDDLFVATTPDQQQQYQNNKEEIGSPSSFLGNAGGIEPNLMTTLGLSSEFGVMVVGDAIGVWDTACGIIAKEEDESGGRPRATRVAAKCLDIMGVVCAAAAASSSAARSAPAVSLWLDLWRTSMLCRNADARIAAASMVRFIGLIPSTDIDVLSMASDLLARNLCYQQEEEDHESCTLSQQTLKVVAWMLTMQQQQQQQQQGSGVHVPEPLANLFVSTYVSQLGSPTTRGDKLQQLLDIPGIVCSVANSTIVRLARTSIPLLAKLFYVAEKRGDMHEAAKAIQALAVFGTAQYADADQSTGAMAAVLMVLLSMILLLPHEGDIAEAEGSEGVVAAASHQCIVGEAIVKLATALPDTFKRIVVRLSATQPQAKQRLEWAIRSQQQGGEAKRRRDTRAGQSRSGSLSENMVAATGAETAAAAAVELQQTSNKIVLKDSFGF
ncbi:hypothetical protein LPJ81_000352 [Coemansia sp. IMI 209127]|nr:hypothetical protein LPJ81_000352 [Coemansia sp. IMI 209127]